MDYLPRMPRQCGIPERNPGDEVREWDRRQGEAALRIETGSAIDPGAGEFVKLGPRGGEKLRLVLTHLASEAVRTGALIIFANALRDRGESHREQHPPGSLPDKRGVDRFVIEQVNRRRQRAVRKHREKRYRSAKRVDHGGQTCVGRAKEVAPVFDRAEGRDQVVLMGSGRAAEPGVVGEVGQQFRSLMRRLAREPREPCLRNR